MLAASMSDASMSAGSEMHARAEKRVHGALAVRGHEDEAAGGWLALVGRRRVVGDAERADVVAENAAELVGSDPADEAAFRPERGKPGDGVGGGASGALDGRAHGLIEAPGLAGRDQAHEALGEVVLGEKGVVAAGDDVDDGVADAHHVVAAPTVRFPPFRHDCVTPFAYVRSGIGRDAHYIRRRRS